MHKQNWLHIPCPTNLRDSSRINCRALPRRCQRKSCIRRRMHDLPKTFQRRRDIGSQNLRVSPVRSAYRAGLPLRCAPTDVLSPTSHSNDVTCFDIRYCSTDSECGQGEECERHTLGTSPWKAEAGHWKASPRKS